MQLLPGLLNGALPDKSMNILLTNDDGINSEGIQKLAKVLRSVPNHRVFIIAPDCNRSGISNAISMISGPVKLTKHGEDTYSCGGYPADCVLIALLGGIPARPDIVLSGINQGENLGTDIIYSGTAAAARQASLAGIPGIALSLADKEHCCWDMAVSWSADHLNELVSLWKKDHFLNVNIPNCPDGPDGMLVAPTGKKSYNDSINRVTVSNDTDWCFLSAEGVSSPIETGSDRDAVEKNFVSVSSIYNFPFTKKD